MVNTPNTGFLLFSSLRPEPEDKGTAALADNPGPAASQTASSDSEAVKGQELTEPPVVEDVKTASPNIPGTGEAEGSGQASSEVPDIQANTVTSEETENAPADQDVQYNEEEESEESEYDLENDGELSDEDYIEELTEEQRLWQMQKLQAMISDIKDGDAFEDSGNARAHEIHSESEPVLSEENTVEAVEAVDVVEAVEAAPELSEPKEEAAREAQAVSESKKNSESTPEMEVVNDDAVTENTTDDDEDHFHFEIIPTPGVKSGKPSTTETVQTAETTEVPPIDSTPEELAPPEAAQNLVPRPQNRNRYAFYSIAFPNAE